MVLGEGLMSYGRIIAADHNRLVQGCGSLLGIASGLLADRELNDAEIRFLSDWLQTNADIAAQWPGDVLCQRVREALADGIVTSAEREHLVETLTQICGGSLQASQGAVNQLGFDEGVEIKFPQSAFCVTGDFVFGPRDRVGEEIVRRGGLLSKGVTKKLHYLVVGLRGSEEWKHGSFGTKIVKAVEYKRAGAPIFIVREDDWTRALA
jgi:NAD-dependent DNA ligase